MSLEKCTLCPRKCNVPRSDVSTGYCGVGDDLYVARAALHMWEEAIIQRN